MSETQHLCERCGQPALVHITNEIGQEGAVRHYCLACASREEPERRRGDRRLNRGVVLLVFGTFTLAFSAFADQLGFGRSEGFDWKQEIALILGLILLCVGTLLRVATLFVIGWAATLLALLSDWLRLGQGEGFGMKQVAGTALGLLLMIAGVLRVLSAGGRRK